jgi:[acyl-carrier-protein] S-malonyltransferase
LPIGIKVDCFNNAITRIAGMGVEKLIELGPGKVLTGLTKRIEKSLNANAVLDLASVTAILQEIK